MKTISRQVKLTLSDFAHEDSFELNSYISYLFNPFTITVADNHPEIERIVRQENREMQMT